VHPGNARLERHAVYTFNARYADVWHAGRVFLAGDAAHLMPHFAGQGMCSGLRDAANLAWKLDLVLEGLAADALLDSYQSERMPSARAAIDFSVELGKVICVPDPAAAAARDEAMAAGVDGTGPPPGLPDIDQGFIHPTAPHAGIQLVQGKVGGRPFDEVHGNGWRLVVRGADAAPVAAVEQTWFETIGGKVVVLDEPDPWFDQWFIEHDTTYALQRPDFYLYGTAPTSEAATELLADLRRHLTRETTT
jgi:resorcinol 4-hydroxylase (NADPH)